MGGSDQGPGEGEKEGDEEKSGEEVGRMKRNGREISLVDAVEKMRRSDEHVGCEDFRRK